MYFSSSYLFCCNLLWNLVFNLLIYFAGTIFSNASCCNGTFCWSSHAHVSTWCSWSWSTAVLWSATSSLHQPSGITFFAFIMCMQLGVLDNWYPLLTWILLCTLTTIFSEKDNLNPTAPLSIFLWKSEGAQLKKKAQGVLIKLLDPCCDIIFGLNFWLCSVPLFCKLYWFACAQSCVAWFIIQKS